MDAISQQSAQDQGGQLPGVGMVDKHRASRTLSPMPNAIPILARMLVAALGVLASANAFSGPVAREAKLKVPFAEEFNGHSLDADWRVQTDSNNSVSTADGELRFRAGDRTRAWVERPLGVDCVRVCAGLKAGAAESPAMLLLRWDESNFIQFGLNYPAAGRLNVREVLGTYPHDYDPGASVSVEWQTLAIELAKDCIRYLVSTDGKAFECLHISRRLERYAGAPKTLGLGQDFGGKLFARPTPWIAPPATGSVAEIAFRDLRIVALSAKAAKASATERRLLAEAERDRVGEQELAADGDPSFDSTSRHFPPMKWSREIVGVKDHPLDIGVAADGSLQLTDSIATFKGPTAHFEINGYRFGSRDTGCAKELENGWMPVVTTRDAHDGLQLEQTVFGWAQDFSPDEPLLGYVRLRATNPSESSQTVALKLAFNAASNVATPLQWRCELAARESKLIAVRVPFRVLENPATEIPLAEFESKLGAVTGCWEKLIAQGSRFEIPEARVQNAYRAWLAYNFLNVAKRKNVFHVCDGSGFYNEVYGYSAALYCNALDLLGYHDLADTYLDSLLTFVQTNGLLVVNFGDTDTGAALWAMSDHYRLTGDVDWLRRVAPKMRALCGWITEQRRAALARTSETALTRGLIRYRPYADLLHPAADYFSNGYLWKGLDATAQVFAEIGLTEDAVRLKAEAEAYLKDIRASMKAAVFQDRGMKILPAIPDTRELWKESNGSADGYYGIIAPCLLEAGVPAWNEPEAKLIVDALEQRGGLVAGVSQFHSMADHAYTYGYWMNCLQRDDIKRAILGLYGSLAYGMSRDTYAAVECTMIRTGENYWTLPHTYSNTQQLRLLRNLLVREDGDTLWLGQAIPRDWLTAGKRVAVNEAPTTFGPVSYSVEVRADGTMNVQLSPPSRTAPKQVLLRLRHPQRLNIATVTLEGTARCKSSGDLIRLTEVGGQVRLNVTFKPGDGRVVN